MNARQYDVDVSRRAPHSPPLSPRTVRAAAKRMLDALELDNVELSVLLTDDVTIQQLNETHRGIDRPTDVLAFPQDAPEGVAVGRRPLGDVVISIDTASRQAEKQGHGLMDEVLHLLAHGLLHLVGYDHQNAAEERRMNAQARRLLDRANGRHQPRRRP